MNIFLVDIAALPDAVVDGPRDSGGAPDDAFMSVLRDASDGVGKDAGDCEAVNDAAASLSAEAPGSVVPHLASPALSLEATAEPEEGKMDFPEDRGDDESPAAFQSSVMAMGCQAALPFFQAAEKAADESASGPALEGPMPPQQGRLAENTPFEAANGAPDDFDKQAATGVDIQGMESTEIPETANPPDAAPFAAYQAGDMKPVAESHGHAGKADGLEQKADDSSIKVEGRVQGAVAYVSNQDNGASAYESGSKEDEGGDRGAPGDKAVRGPAGASESGLPVFSLLKEDGVEGKAHVSKGSPAPGPSGVEEVYRRFEDAVSSVRSRAVRSVRLRLHPENMGELSLKLTDTDSVISARITVASPVVKDILDADSSRLRDIFLAQGLSLGKCSVELSSNLSSNDAGGFMRDWDGNGHGGGGAPAMRTDPVAGRGPERGLTGAYGTLTAGRGGIDVFV